MPEREDLYIRHQVALAQLTKGEIATLKQRFDGLESSLIKQLRTSGPLTELSKARINLQIKTLQRMSKEFYATVKSDTLSQFKTLAKLEASWNVSTLKVIGSERGAAFAPITGSSVMQALRANPYQGAVFNDWWKGLDTKLQTTLDRTIRHAWATGETLQSVEAALGDTLRQAGQNTGAVVRSGIADVAATARAETFNENPDEIAGTIWIATLDSKTSSMCRIRDGLVYTLEGEPVGHNVAYAGGPGKAHWGCRSTSVPILQGEKPEDVLEELERPSFDYNEETTTKSKATMRYDADERRVVKKGERNPSAERRGKPTQTNSTYPEWFNRQPAWTQDSILGKRKGALYRKGEIGLDAFSESGIKPISLKTFAGKAATTATKSAKKLVAQSIKTVADVQPVLSTAVGNSNFTVVFSGVAKGFAKARRLGTEIKRPAVRIERAKIVQEEVLRLRSEFPKIRMDGLDSIFLRNAPRSRASLGSNDQRVMLLGSPRTADTVVKYKEWAAKNEGKNWSITAYDAIRDYTPSSLVNTLRHELGHTFTTRTIQRLWLTTVRNHTVKGAGSPVMDYAWFEKNVSQYAGTNWRESLAECFSMYTSPVYKAGDLPAKIEAVMEKMTSRGVGEFGTGANDELGGLLSDAPPPKDGNSRLVLVDRGPGVEADAYVVDKSEVDTL